MAKQTANDTLPRRESFTGIENRNFLSPVGFKFAISRMRGVDFFCQSASIPSISMGTADQPTRFNNVPHPGDELYYEDLHIRFMVDENMKNWYQVHDWMRKIATPYAAEEFTYDRGKIEGRNPFKREQGYYYFGDNQWRSDASLFILSSNYQPVAEFIFKDAYPISLTTLNFDASVPDVNFFTAEVVMRYTYYNYFIYDAAQATDKTMPPNYQVSENGRVLREAGDPDDDFRENNGYVVPGLRY